MSCSFNYVLDELTGKYTAVLEAQAMVDHTHACPSVKVLLAFEIGMPRQFNLEAKSLGGASSLSILGLFDVNE